MNNAAAPDPDPQAVSPSQRRDSPTRRRAILPAKIFLPALFLLLVVGFVLLARSGETMRQYRIMYTPLVVGGAAGLFLVWALLLSGFRARVRLGIALFYVLLIALAASSLRIVDVKGDLIPVFAFRWSTPRQIETVRPDTPASDELKDAAADYPRFGGPSGDFTLDSPALSRDWPADGPRLLWRIEMGPAWSAFAVAGHRAVTQEQQRDSKNERVVCYDLFTGDELWSHEDVARYGTTIAGVGPRATPTIHNDRVFTVGATGVMNCLDLNTGDVVWSKSILTDHGQKTPEWGYASSPLIVDDTVVVPVGGKDQALVAYDVETGEKRWSAGDDEASYSSPMLATIDGVRQIVILNHHSVAGHDPTTGAMLWQHSWPATRYSAARSRNPKVTQPIVWPDGRVFLTSSYGVGCALLQVTRDGDAWATSVEWDNLNLKSKFSNVVTHGGFVYGLDDGDLTCLNLEDGEWEWRDGYYGHGQIILVNDLLLIQAEEPGDIALVEASPDDYTEVARFAPLSDKTWNHATLAGRLLIVRNAVEAACFVLPVSE